MRCRTCRTPRAPSPRCPGGGRTTTAASASSPGTWTRTRRRRASFMSRKFDDDLEAFAADAVGQRSPGARRVVDRREVDAHRVAVVERPPSPSRRTCRGSGGSTPGRGCPCAGSRTASRLRAAHPGSDGAISRGAPGSAAPVDGISRTWTLAPAPVGLPAAQQLAVLDQTVQCLDRMEQRLGRRRATGRVHVDGNDLVDALDDRVVVEHAAARWRRRPSRCTHLGSIIWS